MERFTTPYADMLTSPMVTSRTTSPQAVLIGRERWLVRLPLLPLVIASPVIATAARDLCHCDELTVKLPDFPTEVLEMFVDFVQGKDVEGDGEMLEPLSKMCEALGVDLHVDARACARQPIDDRMDTAMDTSPGVLYMRDDTCANISHNAIANVSHYNPVHTLGDIAVDMSEDAPVNVEDDAIVDLTNDEMDVSQDDVILDMPADNITVCAETTDPVNSSSVNCVNKTPLSMEYGHKRKSPVKANIPSAIKSTGSSPVKANISSVMKSTGSSPAKSFVSSPIKATTSQGITKSAEIRKNVGGIVQIKQLQKTLIEPGYIKTLRNSEIAISERNGSHTSKVNTNEGPSTSNKPQKSNDSQKNTGHEETNMSQLYQALTDKTTPKRHGIFLEPSSSTEEQQQAPSSPPYHCPSCDMSFEWQSSLNRHMAVHSESNRVYVCDTCHKVFSHKGHLDYHMATHKLDEKQFECNVCNTKFIRKSDMRKHVRMSSKPIQCNICDRKFCSEFRFKQHERSHFYLINEGGNP